MSNSNIKHHNYQPFDIKIHRGNYWDFHLARPTFGYVGNPLDCLSADIDASKECVKNNNSTLISKVEWENAINENIKLENIGLNCVDNGRFLFPKKLNDLSTEEFNKVFYDSIFEPKTKQLILKVAKSNDGKLYLPTPIIENNSIKFNGGFYQGIFATDVCDYKVLPTDFSDGAMYEFEMKVNSELNTPSFPTLNKLNPDASGIFFYMGLRAENKWARYYNGSEGNNAPIIAKNGSDVTKYGIQYVESDNKYLMFDRTKDGFTTDTWVEGTKVLYEVDNYEYEDNPFTIFNKTKQGYTTDTIDEYKNKVKTTKGYFNHDNKYITAKTNDYYNFLPNEPYDILSDLYENAFALQINKDNAIGYKYLVRDCDAEVQPAFKIEQEFSKENIIPKNKWFKISLRIIPDGSKTNMRLQVYLDGNLILVSRMLPMLRLRKLNDEDFKQEGVPYTISLGGGTQGLYNVIYPDYKEQYKFHSPLFKNFGGTFFGNIKRFRVFACDKTFEDINKL